MFLRVLWTCTDRKRSRSQDANCTGIAQQSFDPTECFKRPRMAGDVSEACFLKY
jgi:hypothetical protein